MKKNFLISLPVSLLAVILNFLYKSWAAHMIPKEILGNFFTLVDAISFIMMIFIGFRSSMIASYAKYKDDEMIVSVFACCIIGVTLVLMSLPWMTNPSHLHPFVVDIIVLSFSLYIYLSNQLSIYKLYSLMNHLTFWEPVTLLISFAVCLYSFCFTNEELLASSLIISTLLMALLAGGGKIYHVGITSWKKITFDQKTKEFLLHSASSSVEFLAGMALVYLAVIVVVLKGDPTTLGDFQVVAKSFLMYAIMIFVFPLFKFVLPEFATLYHEKRYHELVIVLAWFKKYAMILGVIFPLMWYIFGKQLLTIAFPPSYLCAYEMVLILSLFFGPIVYNGVMIAFLRGCHHFRVTLLIRLSGLFYFLLSYFILDFFINESTNLMLSIGLSYLFMALTGKLMTDKCINQMS